ncbi:hypothetical protein SEA_HONK_54 [Microbacterium phage Honk]|uniref:DUF4258 domain-containing protein n=1 Tax=Microbacterium phage Honk TaxID=2836095 RepID=A0A8F3INU9_9CAUD|nr:hypothetical protein SEA_HONK_54 [Microbacterium phage Honk]
MRECVNACTMEVSQGHPPRDNSTEKGRANMDPRNPDYVARLHPTRHAAERMAARAVTWEDVLVAVRRGSGHAHRHGGRTAWRVFYGDLMVVIALDRPLVITVGLRSDEQWSDEDVRNRRR